MTNRLLASLLEINNTRNMDYGFLTAMTNRIWAKQSLQAHDINNAAIPVAMR
jgi:hypothetical protein